jgi:hypothetical protein
LDRIACSSKSNTVNPVIQFRRGRTVREIPAGGGRRLAGEEIGITEIG